MTASMSRIAAPAAPPSEADFSLVLGGPLFQFLRHTHLTDDALGLLHRRILFAVLVLWAPIMALSMLNGGPFAGRGRAIPLLGDIGFHLRFLVVVPLLIVAERVVHRWLAPLVQEFRSRGLVAPVDAARFEEAVGEAARWRNSPLAEFLLLAAVYAVGVLFTFRRYGEMGTDGWYLSAAGKGLSPAGFWFVFASLPLLQFLLLRWYYRLFLWAKFMWRVSRLKLDLNAIHPDKSGGLGFLSESLVAFVPIAAAHGMLFAGSLADRIFFSGARLVDYHMEVLGGVVFLMIVFAGPLTVFAPPLGEIKRRGLLEYGGLGQTYVRDFRVKWLGGGAPPDEQLIGSGDIQSLADLGNSFATVQQMRITPIKALPLVYFVVAFLAPIAPLLLTMMSMERLIEKAVGLVF
jgi:hypothetical protein